LDGVRVKGMPFPGSAVACAGAAAAALPAYWVLFFAAFSVVPLAAAYFFIA
jgi:hypothetical protein